MNPIDHSEDRSTLNQLIETQGIEEAADYLRNLHPSDGAALISELEEEEQAAIINALGAEELAEVLERMDEEEMVEVSQHLETDELASVLDVVEPDVAADLLGELDPEEASLVLEQMTSSDAIETLMAYPPETAGGIMNVAPPALRRTMTIAEAFEFLRQRYANEHELYYLYVVDRYGRLIGVMNLRSLILARPEQSVEEIMNPTVFSIQADADQEKVAELLAHYDLLAIPVVDAANHLIGVVAVDDVVDVITEEATEDIYRLAQVGEDATLTSPILEGIRSRLPWLLVNLITALLASSVVALFESTIARMAILAAFLPIVAGEGGNAGSQTMTIMVRSLALGELTIKEVWSVLWREFRLGLLHGLILGLLTGFLGGWWTNNFFMGLVLGIAMLTNLLVASVAGVLIPALLEWLGVDPALASSVFVSTLTDLMGFAVFLGLAALLLM